jgi:hypothetical protein
LRPPAAKLRGWRPVLGQLRTARTFRWSRLMNPETAKRIEAYLKRTLNPGLTLVARPRVTDSMEVTLGGEHVGLVYLIEDEGETSYQLEMTILQEDLDD